MLPTVALIARAPIPFGALVVLVLLGAAFAGAVRVVSRVRGRRDPTRRGAADPGVTPSPARFLDPPPRPAEAMLDELRRHLAAFPEVADAWLVSYQGRPGGETEQMSLALAFDTLRRSGTEELRSITYGIRSQLRSLGIERSMLVSDTNRPVIAAHGRKLYSRSAL